MHLCLLENFLLLKGRSYALSICFYARLLEKAATFRDCAPKTARLGSPQENDHGYTAHH